MRMIREIGPSVKFSCASTGKAPRIMRTVGTNRDTRFIAVLLSCVRILDPLGSCTLYATQTGKSRRDQLRSRTFRCFMGEGGTFDQRLGSSLRLDSNNGTDGMDIYSDTSESGRRRGCSTEKTVP